MAPLTIRAVKLAAAGFAMPLVSVGKLYAASEEDEKKSFRACDLPVYNTTKKVEQNEKQERPEPNWLKRHITEARVAVTDSYRSVRDSTYTAQVVSFYEVVKEKTEIGIEHSKSALDYVQNNPTHTPRAITIGVVTMGTLVVCYRKHWFKKILYPAIAGGSSAMVCYPHFTVDLSKAIAEDILQIWKDKIGWPLNETSIKSITGREPPKNVSMDVKKREAYMSELYGVAIPGAPMPMNEKRGEDDQPPVIMEVKGDPGQSIDEDRDLYSTRG